MVGREMSSRSKYIAKNITFGYIANIVALFLNFVSRTVFIYTLGDSYLGISGLFGNVLGILSFAELGIGTAMNYGCKQRLWENKIFDELL